MSVRVEQDGPVAVITLQRPELRNSCLRADRASAYAGWSRDLAEALLAEARRGEPVLAAESRSGAERFASGKGRGGSFSDI